MAQVAASGGIESFIEEIAEARRSMGNQSTSFRSSLMSNLSGIFGRPSFQFGEEDVIADCKDDDEEALHWAAIEYIPSYKRMRASILKEYEYDENGVQVINRRVVDVGHLRPLERHMLIEKLVTDAEQDNEKFLRKLKDRIDR